MTRALDWLRTEPDVERPPVRLWRDWLLAAAVAAATMAEVVLRADLTWPPVAALLGGSLAWTMLWRRTRPLAMVAVGFGALILLDVASALVGAAPVLLYAAFIVVVLVYALFRWGSAGQVVLGSVMVLSAWLVSVTIDFTGITDAGGGLVVLLLSAALGAVVRYRRLVRAQQVEQIRFDERETLARELHDTVAHHVSAIAIQAQAGRVLVTSHDLDGVAETLEAIDTEASSALAEMRSMVGSLRQGRGRATQVSQRGVADLEALATAEPSRGLRVEVERRGDLDDLRPSVEAALYRVARESITNAQRHARRATRVRVEVSADPAIVRLTISDDGEGARPATRPAGFGLVGMAERVALLGGTIAAGPGPDGGWTVEALIPRRGGAG